MLIGVLLLIILAAVVAVGGLLYFRNVKPDYEGSVNAPGVRAPVEIWYDSAGVAHVWAHSEEDLYFAQGYAHARERLWQLELFRRVAEGRLSEVMGDDLVDTDKFLRTIGIWRTAAANEQQLPPDMRRLLNAYVAGVNHWIDAHDGAWPPEFTTLRIKPERWTVRNTLAIEQVMAWDLALYQGAASLTQSTRRLGAERAKYLKPAEPAWGETIVESATIPEVPRAAALLLDALSVTRASNAWVIGGSRTKSGKPILANDMHLALRQPGVWYLMALHAPGIDVAGMTLPGVPNVIAGHNRAVAWGFTNVMLDDVDFFIERVDPADSTKYLTPSGPQPFMRHVERLRIKGRDDPVHFTVRATRHGPVVSDFDERMRGNEVIAMQWAAADTSHSLQAFPAFNKARNAQELLAAIPLFNNPHQNIVYADTAGNFGYQMAGRVPLRGARKLPPVQPVPGWTGEWDWNGYLPFSEHPRAPNPANGFVVTANNRQARGPVGDLISNDWDMPYRAMRIREMILSAPKHDAASVHQQQLDVKDLLALRYRDRAVRAARAAKLDEVARRLEAWDGTAERNSSAAAYFYAWYETLRESVAQSLFAGKGNLPRDALNAALDSAKLPWLVARGRGALDSLSAAAMTRAQSIVGDKTWGDMHRVLIAHVMGEVATVERLFDLNVGPMPHRGSPTTVSVAHYVARGFPITTSYGPSERHVVDMANVDGAGGFILPSGQSGLPASKHYSDMFERWRKGGLWLIPLDRALAEKRIVSKLVIKPQ